MSTMTVGELYRILTVLIENGEVPDRVVLAGDVDHPHTIDSLSYINGNLYLQTSPLVSGDTDGKIVAKASTLPN